MFYLHQVNTKQTKNFSKYQNCNCPTNFLKEETLKKIFGLGITLVLLGISTSTVAKATPGDLTFPPLNITYQSRPGTALGQYTENVKLLIWGKFDSINGVPNSGSSPVNTDFTLDNSFTQPSEF